MLTIRLNFNLFVQVIVCGNVIILCKMPAVNCTQGLQILAEDNIIIIGRMFLNHMINARKMTEIACGLIVTLLESSAILKLINNEVSIFFFKKLFGNFQTNVVQFSYILLGKLCGKNGRKERGHGGDGGVDPVGCGSDEHRMTLRNERAQPIVDTSETGTLNPHSTGIGSIL